MSFSAKVERKYKRTQHTKETRVSSMIQTVDITCKNIPLQYHSLDGESAQWHIGQNAVSKNLDELKEILSKDKEWSVTGSVYVWRENRVGESATEEQFGDKDFTYNYKTPSSSDWEKQVGKCCRLAYSLLDHPSYYMSNIPVPE